MKVACTGADSKHYSCWVCWSISVQDTLKCYLCQFQVQNSIFCFQFSYSFFFDLQPRIQTENPVTQKYCECTESTRKSGNSPSKELPGRPAIRSLSSPPQEGLACSPTHTPGCGLTLPRAVLTPSAAAPGTY